MKTIKKYLCDDTKYSWKHIMRFFLNNVLNIGDFVLLMQLKQSMTDGLPPFYREVLSAHAAFLKHLSFESTDLSVLKNMPIFLNKYIVKQGALLYNVNMLKAGFKQLKDLMYEVMPGFYTPQVIYDEVKEMNEKVTMKAVITYYEVVQTSMPLQWSALIRNTAVPHCSTTLPILYFFKGNEWKHLKLITSKFIYNNFLLAVVQKPASVDYWKTVFPSLDAALIWGSWRIRGNSIEAEDNDFRIRHNKVFTNVILHQLDRTIDRHCDICGLQAETLMHLFCNCIELNVFFVKLKNCLRDRLGFDWDVSDSWDVFFLFGIWDKSRVRNVTLCRFLLSHARLAVKLRRNMAHYDHKIHLVWPIFRNMVRKHVRFRRLHGVVDFTRTFLTDNTLVSLDERGNLLWDWGS